MKRMEAATFLVGLALLAGAFAAVDWRLGLGLVGAFLMLAAVDVPWRRT